MIIDFHAHLAYHKIYPEKFLASLSDLKKIGSDNAKQLSLLKLFLRDDLGKKLIKQMDEAGISKSVLLIVDDNEYLGKSAETIIEKYERHSKVLKEYPTRFYVFAGYHPLRKGGFELLKKGIEKYGFHGIKLYPPFNFRVDTDIMKPCYEYANEKGLVILSHTGFSVDGLLNEYADPKYFLNVVDYYPNAKFVLAHAGYKLNNAIVQELIQRDNVYADIAGFQTASKDDLSFIFNKGFNHKILFGTDFPINNMMKPLSHLVSLIENLYRELNIGNKVLLENILYNNAYNLLSK